METRKKRHYWLHSHFKEVGTYRNNWHKKFWHRDGFNLKWVLFRGWAKANATFLFGTGDSKIFQTVLIRCWFYMIAVTWNLIFLLRNQNCWGNLVLGDLKDSDFCFQDLVMSCRNSKTFENLPSFLLFWQRRHERRRHHKELISMWLVLFLQQQKYL